MKSTCIFILIVGLMVCSCDTMEKSIVNKSMKLEKFNPLLSQNLYFLNDTLLLVGSKYFIQTNEEGLQITEINWDKPLFDEYSVIYKITDEIIIGYDTKRNLVIGNIRTKTCNYYYDLKDELPEEDKNKINEFLNYKNDYGSFIAIENNTGYFLQGGISKKGFIKNKQFNNRIFTYNIQTNQKNILVNNRSTIIFDFVAINKGNVALIFEYKNETYLYLDTINNFVNVFNNLKSS